MMKGNAMTMLIGETDSLNMISGKKSATLRKTLIAAALVVCVTPAMTTWSAPAKDKVRYAKGELLRMDSSSCGSKEGSSKTVAGEILGTGSNHKNTQDVLCQDYILQSDRMTYRIRPKDIKHAILLPVGETAEFRIHKNGMFLRVPDSTDDREREYFVLSVTPRPESAESDNRNTVLGHE